MTLIVALLSLVALVALVAVHDARRPVVIYPSPEAAPGAGAEPVPLRVPSGQRHPAPASAIKP